MKNSITAEEALKQAIQYEVDKLKLYKRTMTSIAELDKKDLLKFLANKQMTQIKKLKNLYQSESGRRLMAVKLNNSLKPKLIFNLYRDHLKILDFAIQNDREHMKHFDEMAKNCTDPQGRAMLRKLMMDKQGVIDLLEMEYRVRHKASGKEVKKRKYDMVDPFAPAHQN